MTRADLRRPTGTRHAAVDVTVVPVEEPDAAQPVHCRRAEHAADALTHPEQAHDDALHWARCVHVRQLKACNAMPTKN